MNKCKNCGKEFEYSETDFCSNSCMSDYFHDAVEEALKQDKNHIKKLGKEP